MVPFTRRGRSRAGPGHGSPGLSPGRPPGRGGTTCLETHPAQRLECTGHFRLSGRKASVIRKILIVFEMIKIEHTVFALPFAFLGAFFAARGFPGWATSAWILVAMVGARSAAMAFNRLSDHRFDAINPRTADRALPQGQVSRPFVVVFILTSTALFFWAAWNLNRLALTLAPGALVIVLGYSLTKRFTPFSHLFLGLALAIAPIGGWVAVRASLDLEPLLLSAAVVFWVAGFDVIYACQDAGFDRRIGLHSVPQRFGVERALNISRIFHLLMLGFLSLAFWQLGASWLGWTGLVVVAVSLLYEHSLVLASDLSRVNLAFFTVNGVISIALLVFVALDLHLLA
jgi:4-hydroxybenzoate polyprenyltransferase